MATPTQLGIYTGVLFLGEIGVLLSVAGFNEAASWRIAGLVGQNLERNVPPTVKGILSTSLITSVGVSSILVIFATTVTNFFLKPSSSTLLLTVTCVGIIFRTLGTTSFGILMGKHRIRDYSIFLFLSVIVGQIVGLVLFFALQSVLALAIGWTTGGFVHMLSVLRCGILERGERAILLPDKSLIYYAVGISLSQILLFFSKWLDRFMMIGLTNTDEVGLYSIPATFWAFATYIPLALYISLVPKLARAEAQDKHTQFMNLLRNGTSILLFFLIVVVVFLLPLSGKILASISGHYYLAGESVFQILLIGLPFYGLSLMMTGALKAKGKSFLGAACLFGGVSSGTIIGVLLIPSFGAVGAAISSLVSQMLGALLGMYFLREKSESLLDKRPLGLVIVSSIPGLIVLLILTSNSNVGVVAISYIIALTVELLLWRQLDVVKPQWITILEPIMPMRISTILRRILIRE